MPLFPMGVYLFNTQDVISELMVVDAFRSTTGMILEKILYLP